MRLIAILLFESLLILANPLNKKQSEEWMDSNKISLNPAKQLTGDVHGNEAYNKKPHEEIVSDQITVWELAVGQGDCTYIICPNNDLVIIDMGSSSLSPYILNQTDVGNIFVNYLKSYPSSKLRIITHPDRDHFNYIQDVLTGLESSVDYIILAGDYAGYTPNFYSWVSRNFPNRLFIIKRGESCYGNTDCKILSFGGRVITPNFCNNDLVKFTILAANLGDKIYSKSTVIKMQYGNISMLFPGDFGSNDAQDLIIDHYRDTEELRATIYKMAHYGGETYSLFYRIKAEAAFTNQVCPTSSNYAFPRCDVIKYLVSCGIINDSRSYPFVCGNYHRQPRVYTQWNYQIYETCREPYSMCYNIRIQLNQTHYGIDYVSLAKLGVKRSDEGMEV